MDAALRLARVFLLQSWAFYTDVPHLADSRSCGWVSRVRFVLAGLDILAWDIWSSTVSAPSSKGYKCYLKNALARHGLTNWYAEVRNSRAAVPYYLFQSIPCSIIADLRGRFMAWSVCIGLRSWLRLRAGVLCLRHVNGNRSSASHQSCIFCSRVVPNETRHVIFIVIAGRRNDFNS